MTSEERHEARYQRRKARRLAKVEQDSRIYADPQRVFSTQAIARGFQKSRRASKWKPQVQRFRAKAFTKCRKESRKLLDGTWKPYGFTEFDIVERGKPRHIQAVCIAEKAVQASLSNESLVPILSKHLIYDNGASLKDKGTDFHLARFEKHLLYHYRRHGFSGGVYFFDFHHYFMELWHSYIKGSVARYIRNRSILRVYDQMVDSFEGEQGLGLGSQVSQISAVFYPNSVDHWLKDQLGIHGTAHYMDDGYIFHPDIRRLKQIAAEFGQRCAEIGILLNEKKCRIFRIRDHFQFLKVRYHLTDSGALVSRISRECCKKERRRLRKFRELLYSGELYFEEVRLNFHSWLCSKVKRKCFWTVVGMIAYFNEIFREYGPYELPRKPRQRQKKRYRLLQAAIREAAA